MLDSFVTLDNGMNRSRFGRRQAVGLSRVSRVWRKAPRRSCLLRGPDPEPRYSGSFLEPRKIDYSLQASGPWGSRDFPPSALAWATLAGSILVGEAGASGELDITDIIGNHV
jgi:hypothetical protein